MLRRSVCPQMRLRFTLVELLTVVAVIVLLCMILLPALRSALSSSRIAHCANNLAKMGILYHAWAKDNHGFQVGYTNFTANLAVMEGLGPDASTVINTKFRVSSTNNNPRPELYQTIFGCPEAPADIASGTSYYTRWMQYSLRRYSGLDRKIRVSRFNTPSKTFIIIDSRGYWYLEHGKGSVLYDQRGISNRHDWRTNVLFCDGHVKTFVCDGDPGDIFSAAVVGSPFWKDYWP